MYNCGLTVHNKRICYVIVSIVATAMGEVWLLGLGANHSIPFPTSPSILLALEVGHIPLPSSPFFALPSRPSSPPFP